MEAHGTATKERFEFSMPFRQPFNDSALTENPIIMPILRAWLGHPQFQINLEIAAHISAGPGTASQVPELEPILTLFHHVLNYHTQKVPHTDVTLLPMMVESGYRGVFPSVKIQESNISLTCTHFLQFPILIVNPRSSVCGSRPRHGRGNYVLQHNF